MDQAHRHRLVLLAGDGVLDAGFQNLAAINDCPDFRNGAERGVLFERVPVAVECDQAGLILWHVLIENAFHAHGQSLEHLALFYHGDTLEGVDVIGMHREEPDKLVHALVEPTVVFGERHQVFADFGLLFGGFLEQTLGHDKFHVTAGNKNLFETILHTTNAVSYKRKARAIENSFLNTCHKTKTQIFAYFAYFTQEVEVKDQLLILTGA